MRDYNEEVRRRWIKAGAPRPKLDAEGMTRIEQLTLEQRRAVAIERLRQMGKRIIELGNTFRPDWRAH